MSDRNETILAILNLYVALMPHIKFRLNPTYGLGGVFFEFSFCFIVVVFFFFFFFFFFLFVFFVLLNIGRICPFRGSVYNQLLPEYQCMNKCFGEDVNTYETYMYFK